MSHGMMDSQGPPPPSQSGPRDIHQDFNPYAATHPHLYFKDELRKDRDAIPKLQLEPHQARNASETAFYLERWWQAVSMAIDTWSQTAAVHFEVCLEEALRRYSEFQSLDARDRAA